MGEATPLAVVEIVGRSVGLTGLFELGGSGEVEPVVVTENLRGARIGWVLIRRVADHAAARGYEYLTIRPVARNAAAIRRFHVAGFRTSGGHAGM